MNREERMMADQPALNIDPKLADVAAGLNLSDPSNGASTTNGNDDIPLEKLEGVSTPSMDEHEIGRVAIPRELFLSRSESHIEIYVPLVPGEDDPNSRRNQVAVGDYVVIPLGYRNEKIFGVIEKIQYTKRSSLDDTSEVHALVEADRIDEKEYIQTALVEPLSMFADNDPKAQEVRFIPKPNSIARRAASEEEVKLGLNLPDDGIFLGYVAVGGERITVQGGFPIPLYLRNDAEKGDPLVFTHSLIAGMSGRGKTFNAKNFLRQLVGHRYVLERKGGANRELNLIVIDPDNEYHLMAEDGYIDPHDETTLQGQLVQFGGIGEKLKVFDAVEGFGSRYTGAKAHTPFTIPFTLVSQFKYLIAGGELNEGQYEALVRIVDTFFVQNKTGSYKEFQAFILDDEQMLPYTESGMIHKGTLEALRRRVCRRAFENIFDQPQGTPITDLYEDMFDEGIVSVFPTDHLGEVAERVVVLTVMSMVADAKTKGLDAPWAQQIAKHPVVLAVDEAHNYLAKSETQQDREINEKFISAAKQGRKNRLGLVLITQNPQDIHDGVLSQISNRVLLGMERKMAESAGAPSEFLRSIPYYEKGRMVINSPDNCQPVEILGLHFCVVKH
jgi:hypothetical protein